MRWFGREWLQAYVGAQTGRADRRTAYSGSGRAAWMQNPKYTWGVMTHYLADWQARVNKLEMTVDLWNKMVDGFDAEAMAKRLEQVGAGHYQISIGQNSGYYLSPNAAYDKIVGINPSKCSRRDLVADLYEPLHKRDIKLMTYLPSGAPGSDKAACAALEWQNGPSANKEFPAQVGAGDCRVVSAWGSKVVGWWFDGCYFSQFNVPLGRGAKLYELCCGRAGW